MPDAQLPDVGKISPEVFSQLIYPRLGALSDDVIVGPTSGVDVGIVRIGDQAVALTTDPVFIVPQFGWERAAWFAIHILLSDAATSGLPPKYLTIDLNLPREISREGLDAMWGTIHEECEKHGVAIVTGHTARYDGCNFPMVGGATVIAIGPEDTYVTPALISEGDHVIITKGPAIEATGLFAVGLADLVDANLGVEFRKRAEEVFFQMSIVEDARIAVECGVRENGVTSMHDATECGIYGALYETAEASHLGMLVDKNAIPAQPEPLELCAALGIDPYAAISEGTLVLTCRPHASDTIVSALEDAGIPAAVVGEMTAHEAGMRIVDDAGERPLEHPRTDPFWAVFDRGMRGEWG